MRVRPAELSDLDDIVALTARHRRELATWSPVWWRPSVGADDVHRAWLAHLLERADVVARVVEDDGSVIGCALAVPHGDEGWLIDDLAFDGVGMAGNALLAAIEERPAVLCLASADMTARQLARDARLEVVATYWISTPVPAAGSSFTASNGDLPVPPAHTFAAAFDAETTILETADGLVVATGPVAAPAIYDPGGTVCVVDRVVGTARGRLLAAASAAASERGDVLVVVVCAAADRELERRLTSAGFERTVEVVAWPPRTGV